jgi:hypothetical protein
MVIKRKELTSVLLGVFALQLLLPLVLVVSIFFVRTQQHELFQNEGDGVEIALQEYVADGGEVEYGGVLYDVQHVERRNGQYIIYAMADCRETQLVALSGRVPDNMQATKSLKVFPFFFLYHEAVAEHRIFFSDMSVQRHALFAAQLLPGVGAVDLRPPRCVWLV